MVKYLKRRKKQLQGNPVSKNSTEIPIIETAPGKNQEITPISSRLTIENIEYNLYILRKFLPDPNLTLEYFAIGKRSKTKVVIAYLQDVANTKIVSEIKSRLDNIQAEVILDSSYIERNIQNSTLSPFPQLENTKKPDVIVSALTQGRIAIFVDNSPSVLLAPTTFFDILDTPDDAYRRWFVASK